MVKSSKKIYELNHPDPHFLLGDLNDINIEDIPKHEILCGGFPCQPFSIAGKRKGFDDERSNVFWKIIKIIKRHKPDIIVLENVKNLKSHDNGDTYKIIKKNIKKQGYYVKSSILNTCDVTICPQNRERIYIVCFKDKKKYKKFNFDFEHVDNNDIKNFLEDNIPEKYYYTNKFKVYDKIKEKVTEHINTNTVYQYRRHYVRQNKSGYCPTLTANMGSGGHNVPILLDDKGIRKFTPRECFNLQGFPKTYELPDICDGALYKLSGNAVSVPIVRLIVKKLDKLI